jgi:16S rRNA (uracil1498-N3)-methyltransferase
LDLPDVRARLIVASLPARGAMARVSGQEADHARARRVRAGDAVALLDGSGRAAVGVVRRIGKGGLEVEVAELREAVQEDGPELTLLVCAIRTERLSWIVEKATELGAARVVIVSSARTQPFRASDGALLRLSRIVREAAKQCGRARWPEVRGAVSFEEALETPEPQRLLLDSQAPPFPAALRRRPIALLVGPEGGWLPEERARAQVRGWRLASLPAGRLRAETAAIAALVLARAAWRSGRR